LTEEGRKQLEQWYANSNNTETLLLPPNFTKHFYPTSGSVILGFELSSRQQHKKLLAKLFFNFSSKFNGNKQDMVRCIKRLNAIHRHCYQFPFHYIYFRLPQM
jgi:hypothetical protein